VTAAVTGEIRLDTGSGPVPLPVRERMPRRQTITTFPPKQLVGRDVRAGDETLRSVLALSNFAGIGRRRYRQEEEGVERFYYSSLETRFPGFLALPPGFNDATLGGGSSMPNAKFFTETVYQQNFAVPGLYNTVNILFGSGGSTFDGTFGVYTVSGAGAIRGVVPYKGRIFFPCDAQAYAYSDTIAVLGYGTTARFFEHMLPIQQNMYGLVFKTDGSGQKYYECWQTTNATTSTDTWTKLFDVPLYNTKIVDACVGYDGYGNQVIYVITSFELWMIDPLSQATALVYRFRNGQPRHIVCWDRTRGIYVQGDYDVLEVTPSVIRHISPYSDDGLPPTTPGGYPTAVDPLAGKIVDIAVGENWLYVLNKSQDNFTRSSVMAYDTIGWHAVGVGAISSQWQTMTCTDNYVYVQMTDTTTRTFKILDDKRPPWFRLQAERSFAASGTMVTPWFDDDLPGFVKVLLSLDVQGFGFSSTEIVTISYQVDIDNASWTTLGSTPSSFIEGTTTIQYLSGGKPIGLPFKKIRFKIDLQRGTDITLSPIVEDIAVRFVVRPTIQYGWDVVVDCSKDYRGRNAQQLADFCWAAASTQQLATLTYNNEGPFYVLVSAGDGQVATSRDRNSTSIRLRLLQMGP
jgi:hypothetical protein